MDKKVLILGINGSPRKNGNTVKFLNRILDSAKKKGAEVKILHLIDKDIKPCLGCYSIKPGKCTFPCVRKDDMQEIHKILIEADAVVLASPSYWFSVTGLMKNFLDRLTPLEERNLLEGKVGACLSCAEETGGDETANYMVGVLNEMGFLIPPWASPFFNLKGKGTWRVKDLEVLGENIVRLVKALGKNKLVYG